MTTSRVIGALFLAGYLLYGVGGALVASLTGAHHMLATIATHKTLFVLGAFGMLLNTPVDVAKAVLFFPILEQHSKRTALAYLATMIVEVVLLDVGVLALLLIVPLANDACTLTGNPAETAFPFRKSVSFPLKVSRSASVRAPP